MPEQERRKPILVRMAASGITTGLLWLMTEVAGIPYPWNDEIQHNIFVWVSAEGAGCAMTDLSRCELRTRSTRSFELGTF
jgi:hypothetical protein